MAVVRWEPARELFGLQNEMNRLFSSFFESGDGVTNRWVPAMDLYEEGNDLVLKADLPGLDEDDIEVSVEDNVLHVCGERTDEHDESAEGYYRFERSHGTFDRMITLPEGVDPESVVATCDRGVLEVRIPKPVESEPKRIPVGKSQPTVEGRGS